MISVVIPGIRTHLWENVCKTLKESVGKYDWEVIFVGPFDPPKLDYPVKYIKSYAPVGVCIQKGFLAAEKEFIYQTVDDAVFIPNAIEQCVNDWYFSNLRDIDIINMLYSEGRDYSGEIQGPQNWMVRNFPEFWLPYINRSWQTSCQPLMKRDYILEIGGLDCRFQYSNHSHHDLIFRAQLNGSIVYHSRLGVSKADWAPGTSKDHGPIVAVQDVIDKPVFDELWSNPRETHIDINNYKEFDKPWKVRFGQEYKSYEELAEGEGYVLT